MQLKPNQLTRRLELYNIADYLGIDSLQADLLDSLDTHLRDAAYDIWTPGDPDEAIYYIRKNWTDEKLNEFFSAARIAFTDSPVFEPVRKQITDFLRRTCTVIGKDVRFTNALKSVPDLAVAMVEILMDSENQGEKSLVCSQIPKYCEKCGTTIQHTLMSGLGQAWVSRDIGSRKFTVRGLCLQCSKKLNA